MKFIMYYLFASLIIGIVLTIYEKSIEEVLELFLILSPLLLMLGGMMVLGKRYQKYFPEDENIENKK